MWTIRLAVALFSLVAAPTQAQSVKYDLVLANGRVIDPESGLDAVRFVGITSGKIAALSSAPLLGRQTVNVRGQVVAPGFIDLHAHGQDAFSGRLHAQDGVTTALELELGVNNVPAWYETRIGQSIIHFGASASHGGARMLVLADQVARGPAAIYRNATPDEINRIADRVRDWLDQGALGIGFGIAYTPGATRGEIVKVMSVGADRGVTSFVHDRFASVIEPGSSVEAVQELIAAAAVTGASVHMVHVGSSGLRQVPEILDLIAGARRHGIDITTEIYPYTAASTEIQAAIFDEGWRERNGVDYDAIEWVATGERLTASNWDQHRKQGGRVIAHVIPDAAVDYAIANPLVMIASDGTPYINGRAHPRGAGTFARVLGLYVRQKKILSLTDAIRKMTLMPAQRLESAVPQMRNKGRIRVGADADITVFDPEQVIDRATFAEPALPSTGISYVLVGGTFVVRQGKLVDGVLPGQAIRRTVTAANIDTTKITTKTQ